MSANQSSNNLLISDLPQLEENSIDDSLRGFIGYRLKRAYGTIRSDLIDRLDTLGLRITTFSTLLVIVENPGLRQSALASALEIKSSNMVAIIDDLEARGFIRRERAQSDRRAFALHATASGRKLCKKAVLAAEENENTILGCLSETEQETLSFLLEKIEASAKE